MAAELSFTFDETFIEKRTRLLTNCQLGFIGAALMLMMMDLSKLYLLAPLVVGLILSSWYKHNLDEVKTHFSGSSLEFAPKSILIKLPAQSSETRITFREIEEITLHQENFTPTISIYSKESDVEETNKVVLKALKNPQALLKALQDKSQESQPQ